MQHYWRIIDSLSSFRDILMSIRERGADRRVLSWNLGPQCDGTSSTLWTGLPKERYRHCDVTSQVQ